jgi:HEAT repeat protein
MERWAAARALCFIGDQRATPALIERLRDRASSVRSAAAEALGEFGDSTAIEPLRRLRNDRYRGIQMVARQSIRKIEDRAWKRELDTGD